MHQNKLHWLVLYLGNVPVTDRVLAEQLTDLYASLATLSFWKLLSRLFLLTGHVHPRRFAVCSVANGSVFYSGKSAIVQYPDLRCSLRLAIMVQCSLHWSWSRSYSRKGAGSKSIAIHGRLSEDSTVENLISIIWFAFQPTESEYVVGGISSSS